VLRSYACYIIQNQSEVHSSIFISSEAIMNLDYAFIPYQ